MSKSEADALETKVTEKQYEKDELEHSAKMFLKTNHGHMADTKKEMDEEEAKFDSSMERLKTLID